MTKQANGIDKAIIYHILEYMRIDRTVEEKNKFLRSLKSKERKGNLNPVENIVLKREEYFKSCENIGVNPTLNDCVLALGFKSFEELKSKANDDNIGQEIIIAITRLRAHYEKLATGTNKNNIIGSIFMLKVLGLRENERAEETKDLISEALEKAFAKPKTKPIKKPQGVK